MIVPSLYLVMVESPGPGHSPLPYFTGKTPSISVASCLMPDGHRQQTVDTLPNSVSTEHLLSIYNI